MHKYDTSAQGLQLNMLTVISCKIMHVIVQIRECCMKLLGIWVKLSQDLPQHSTCNNYTCLAQSLPHIIIYQSANNIISDVNCTYFNSKAYQNLMLQLIIDGKEPELHTNVS